MAKRHQTPTCKHCTRPKEEHPLPWCSTFEPRGKRSKRREPEPPTIDYLQRQVRETLSKTLHYVADLLMLDPTIVTRATSGLLDGAHIKMDVEGTAPATPPPTPAPKPSKPTRKQLNGGTPPAQPSAKTQKLIGNFIGKTLSKGQRLVLEAVAKHGADGASKTQLIALTKYKRSTLNRLLTELQAPGLITRLDKRLVAATDAGNTALGPNFQASKNVLAETLRMPQRTVLKVIAAHAKGVTRSQLTQITGYSRSTANRILSELRALRTIIDGDLITSTEAGERALGADFERLGSGDSLRDYWLEPGRLSEGNREVLTILSGVWPKSLTRQMISDKTEYARSTVNRLISELQSRRLITVTGDEARADNDLFSRQPS